MVNATNDIATLIIAFHTVIITYINKTIKNFYSALKINDNCSMNIVK